MIVNFLEEFLGTIDLIENLLLLSLELLALLKHTFIVVDLLEAWVFPHSS